MAYQIRNVELASIQPSNFTQASIPELTRPARSILAKHKSKTRKPQGRKATKTTRPAKYHNWHTPACWSQILLAGKEVGWEMSATEIVRALKRRDPIMFAGIQRSTVNSWIDRSGPVPRWKATALAPMENGTSNEPGHTNGGRRGILVSFLIFF